MFMTDMFSNSHPFMRPQRGGYGYPDQDLYYRPQMSRGPGRRYAPEENMKHHYNNRTESSDEEYDSGEGSNYKANDIFSSLFGLPNNTSMRNKPRNHKKTMQKLSPTHKDSETEIEATDIIEKLDIRGFQLDSIVIRSCDRDHTLTVSGTKPVRTPFGVRLRELKHTINVPQDIELKNIRTTLTRSGVLRFHALRDYTDITDIDN